MTTWEPGATLKDVERVVINQALIHFCGNKMRTAIALGISVRTLRNRISKYQELQKWKGTIKPISDDQEGQAWPHE